MGSIGMLCALNNDLDGILSVDFSRIPKIYHFAVMDSAGAAYAFESLPLHDGKCWIKRAKSQNMLYLAIVNGEPYDKYMVDWFNHLWVRGIGYIKYDDYVVLEKRKYSTNQLLGQVQECESLAELKEIVTKYLEQYGEVR